MVQIPYAKFPKESVPIAGRLLMRSSRTDPTGRCGLLWGDVGKVREGQVKVRYLETQKRCSFPQRSHTANRVLHQYMNYSGPPGSLVDASIHEKRELSMTFQAARKLE